MPQITETDSKKEMDKGMLQGLYFLYGAEKYLLHRFVSRFGEKAEKQPFPDFNFQRLDGSQCTAEEIGEAVEALPFMAERKYVLVSDWDAESRSAADGEKLSAVLEDIPESTVLVLYTLALEPDPKRSAKWKKWIAAAGKQGKVLCLERKSQSELEKLLCTAAEKRFCPLSRENAAKIIENCGNDLQRLLNELEKLCAYAQESEITAEMIGTLVSRNLETTVFSLSKVILNGKYQEAYGILDTLLSQNEEPVAILGVLASSYLDMYRVRCAIQSGQTAMEPAKYFDYKNKEFRLRNAERDSRNLSMPTLRACLEALSQADKEIKSGYGDRKLFQRLALEKLMAKLLWIVQGEKKR